MTNKKLVIWNVTSLCPWNCKICQENTRQIKNYKQVHKRGAIEYTYGEELNYNRKMEVVDQLACGNFKLDLSGGELLIDPRNVDLILYAAQCLGPECVGISTSGIFLTEDVIKRLKGRIRNVELSLDYVPFPAYYSKPTGYHEYTAHTVNVLKKNGFDVGIRTVLTNNNMNEIVICRLLDWICQNKVHSWSLLRFIPYNRGKNYKETGLKLRDYGRIVQFIKKITVGSSIEVQFQYLLPDRSGHTYVCRCAKKSIGILPHGLVTACFWSLDHRFNIMDDKFILGKLPEENIPDILFNDKAWYCKNNKHTCALCNEAAPDKKFEQLAKAS